MSAIILFTAVSVAQVMLVAAMAIVVEKRLATKHAIFPSRDHGTSLRFRRVEDRLHRSLHNRSTEFRKQPR